MNEDVPVVAGEVRRRRNARQRLDGEQRLVRPGTGTGALLPLPPLPNENDGLLNGGGGATSVISSMVLSTRTLSRWYGWASLVGFVLAIITAPVPPQFNPFYFQRRATAGKSTLATTRTSALMLSTATRRNGGSISASSASGGGKDENGATVGSLERNTGEDPTVLPAEASWWETVFGKKRQQHQLERSTVPNEELAQKTMADGLPPAWLRWILHYDKSNSNNAATAATATATAAAAAAASDEDKFQWFLGLFDKMSRPTETLDAIPPQPSSPQQPLATATATSVTTTASNEDNPNANGMFASTMSSTLANPASASSPWILAWLDPNILYPHPNTATSLIDKVWTSSLRLFLIANWSMVLTVLVHAAVADWFLGGNGGGGSGLYHTAQRPNGNAVVSPLLNAPQAQGQQQQQQQYEYQPWSALAGGGGSRMGGFLVFKILLISAVVTADVVDLLILLSWYTILAVLRSLDALCSQQTDLSRTAWTGQTTLLSDVASATANLVPSGVWKLLATILCADLTAATVCVTLFREAGYRMVVVLMCDCALLAVDIVTHLLQHVQLVWDVQHAARVASIEEEQLTLWNRTSSTTTPQPESVDRDAIGTDNPMLCMPIQEESNEDAPPEDELGLFQDNSSSTTAATAATMEESSRRLERQMALTEQQHLRRTSFLESAVYVQQLLTDLLSVAYFVHIWTLHGVQFTLIDGVLALHVHSAFTSLLKRITERRNMCRIARDMNNMFENASELDLRKAAAARDVCCICLGSMSYLYNLDGNKHNGKSKGGLNNTVKKVACGHLYHTACLRDVVERARSIEAAKCPLCRSYLVHTNRNTNNRGRQQRNNTARRDGGTNMPPGEAGRPTDGAAGDDIDERGDFAIAFRDPNEDAGRNNDDGTDAGAALFRFSTEGMFPAWIPVPAVSFVVLRRPPLGAAAAAAGADDEGAARNDNERNEAPDQQQQQPSLLRRLLLLAGAVPMSPAEEAAALEQLVDMFPQYERQDLLDGLRTRGSAEAVAESILLGFFTGVPRGMDAR